MHKDVVLIQGVCTWGTIHVFSSVYSCIFTDNISTTIIPSHKCQPMGRKSLEENDQAVVLIEACSLLRQIRNLSYISTF